MKTIAITIEEKTLNRIDALLSGKNGAWKTRSELVRMALQEYMRSIEQGREREIIRKNSGKLKKQAAALVKEQAKQ